MAARVFRKPATAYWWALVQTLLFPRGRPEDEHAMAWLRAEIHASEFLIRPRWCCQPEKCPSPAVWVLKGCGVDMVIGFVAIAVETGPVK